MDSNKRIALLFFILMIIFTFALERILYSSGEVYLTEKAELALLETMKDGLNKQYEALGMLEFGYKMGEAKKFEHCAITNHQGKNVKDILVENEQLTVASDIDTKIRHTILAEKGINADSLFLLWTKELSDNQITSPHALQVHIYRHAKGDALMTCGDSILFKSKYKKFRSVYAGISNEVEFESFIKYSWFTVIRNASIGLIAASEFILLILLLGGCIYFLRRKIKHEMLAIEDMPSSTIRVSNLLYAYDTHEFYVDDRKIQIRAQSASLLLLFLKSPSYSLTKEEIISCLWRPEDAGVQDRVRRAISDLRKLLREESVKITIELSENGYRLIA